MKSLFEWMAANPFALLFIAVALAVWIGKFSFKGYGLGMVAAAIIVGCAMSTWASVYGVKLELNVASADQLEAESQIEIIPGAGHLFEEAGALERVAVLAAAWFRQHLLPTSVTPPLTAG